MFCKIFSSSSLIKCWREEEQFCKFSNFLSEKIFQRFWIWFLLFTEYESQISVRYQRIMSYTWLTKIYFIKFEILILDYFEKFSNFEGREWAMFDSSSFWRKFDWEYFTFLKENTNLFSFEIQFDSKKCHFEQWGRCILNQNSGKITRNTLF